MKHTNTPPVYLLSFGRIGQLTITEIPARLKQSLHIVPFPDDANAPNEDVVSKWLNWLKDTKKQVNTTSSTPTKVELLLKRLLFLRQAPLVICVLNPDEKAGVDKAEKVLPILHRAGIRILGLFLNDRLGMHSGLPSSLLSCFLGYTQIHLEGHKGDQQAYRRAARQCVRQIELLYHLTTYPDRKPSFIRLLPLLLKDSPQFVIAAGFAEENLSIAGRLLTTRLNEKLIKPVRGRSLVMVLSNKVHLGFHEVSIIHGTCSTLLGTRMVVTSGGQTHPHLRQGQYLVIGMVNDIG